MKTIQWSYMKTLILVAATLLAAAPGLAATFHVANDGEDSATCGPPSDPCRSIGTAIENAAEGDTILVRPGSYNGATVPSKGLSIVADSRRPSSARRAAASSSSGS